MDASPIGDSALRLEDLLNFEKYPLWINVLTFLAASAVTWYAGTRLTYLANAVYRGPPILNEAGSSA